MERFGSHSQSFGEVLCADGHNHKFLKVNVIVRVLAAVKDVHHWHRENIGVATAQIAVQGQPCGIGEFTRKEKDRDSGASVHWSIRELTTTKELNAEGRAMHHCVRSYVGNCRRGKVAVFSLQIALEEPRDSSDADAAPRAPMRVMTIAVNARTQQITQVRGRYNALPSGRFEAHQKKRGVDSLYLACLRRSRSIVHEWAEIENLTWGRRI